VKSTDVNGLVFAYPDETNYYKTLVSKFNQYSNANNLEINFALNILTPNNSTVDLNDFESLMETLVNKKSNKYDLYFYYGMYSSRYSDHFLELNTFFSENYLKEFDKEIISKTCLYEDKIIGLVIIYYIYTY